MKHALLLSAAALAACAHAPVSAPIDPAAYVMLERGPCFGRCPVYSVAMNAQGLVRFKGQRNVLQTGEHQQQRAPAEFASLLDEVTRLGVFDLADSYSPGDGNCRRYATDMPSARLEIQNGAQHVTVKHYLGCSEAPVLLRTLEDLIDQRTGSTRWIKEAAAF